MNCFALKKRAPLKVMITGVAVNVKVDQLEGKIPSVCDARRVVHRRQRGVSGETEESLFVLLSFDVESFPNKVMLEYNLFCMSFCSEHITLLQVSSLWACGRREVPRCETCAEGHETNKGMCSIGESSDMC